MKTLKLLLLAVLILCGTNIASGQRKYLDKLPKHERDSILTAMAYATVMKHGPDFYRDFKPPVIERRKSVYNRNEGIIVYRVTYLYDESVESFEQDYAVAVDIRESNGLPEHISFGNSHGFGWMVDYSPFDPNANHESIKVPYKFYPPGWHEANSMKHSQQVERYIRENKENQRLMRGK